MIRGPSRPSLHTLWLLATLLLAWRLELGVAPPWWTGPALALAVSVSALSFGARYLMRQLSLSPAMLLRNAAA